MKRILKISIILVLTIFIGLKLYTKLSPVPPINTASAYYIYDAEEKLVVEDTAWVSITDISLDLINATIATEDKNFYSHNGFDILRIFKAMYINIKNRENLQGASTISQQYSKNLFLNFDKNWRRKLEEALITLRIEDNYTKDEILEGYLNSINYGGVFGIENASKYYFGIPSSELNLAQASMLAGIPKSPSNYSPIKNYDNAKKRQRIILDCMVNNEYISEEEADNAYNEELVFAEYIDSNLSTNLYYRDAVITELKSIKSIPESILETGSLKIFTSYEREAQEILEKNSSEKLKDSELQISSVLMKTNGSIIGILGGTNYNLSQFNRVTSSKRQVGSTLKPFLYYSALENGFTASSAFTSQKTIFALANDKTYSPVNYGDVYADSPISMGAALAYSDNIYAVKTHLFLGEDNLVDIGSRLGLNNLEPIPSLALGTIEINILDMMRAYGTLANEGKYVKPHFIERVEDMNGNVLYEYKNKDESVLNKSSVFILNNLLTGSYDKSYIDYNYPTCISIADELTHKYSIKTGTTNTDSLIFGYNKDYVLGTWLGYDDNRELEVNKSSLNKKLWASTIEEYLKDKDTTWYEKPENVVGVIVNPITGKIDNEKASLFYYVKGTEPQFSENLDDLVPTMNIEDIEKNNS